MTVVELKTEIIKKIDELPEHLLPNVLDFLNELQKRPQESKAIFDEHLKKIMAKNRGLLERFAK